MENNWSIFDIFEHQIIARVNVKTLPNGHNMSSRRRVDVDITSIRQKENIDEFPRHFDAFFPCNINGRKTHIISTYFVRRNIDEWKIDVIPMHLLRRYFDGQKFNFFSMYFFQSNFDWWNVNVFSMYCFDARLMDWKLAQLWHAFHDVFLKDKNWWSFWYLFLISFPFIKTKTCLDVSFHCAFILMSFFNVISFHSVRCLSTLTLAWRSLEKTSVLSKLETYKNIR